MILGTSNHHLAPYHMIKKALISYSVKPAVMLAIALVISLLLRDKRPKIITDIVLYKPGCVEGFYDEFKCSVCENGKWNPADCLPKLKKYAELIQQCARNESVPGCLDGKFYRHLTQECKDNPSAALCDGYYDYQRDFLDEVSQWSEPVRMRGSLPLRNDEGIDTHS
jgi:hypothetical protein